jgi:hypothetical protein
MGRPNPRRLQRQPDRHGDGTLGIRAGGQDQAVPRDVPVPLKSRDGHSSLRGNQIDSGTSPVDLSAETIISLKEVCRLVPGRTGKGLALTTVFRWSFHGCRGKRLETFLIGGTRFTTLRNLNCFIAAINQRPADGLSTQPSRHQDQVEDALVREGL